MFYIAAQGVLLLDSSILPSPVRTLFHHRSTLRRGSPREPGSWMRLPLSWQVWTGKISDCPWLTALGSVKCPSRLPLRLCVKPTVRAFKVPAHLLPFLTTSRPSLRRSSTTPSTLPFLLFRAHSLHLIYCYIGIVSHPHMKERCHILVDSSILNSLKGVVAIPRFSGGGVVDGVWGQLTAAATFSAGRSNL